MERRQRDEVGGNLGVFVIVVGGAALGWASALLLGLPFCTWAARILGICQIP